MVFAFAKHATAMPGCCHAVVKVFKVLHNCAKQLLGGYLLAQVKRAPPSLYGLKSFLRSIYHHQSFQCMDAKIDTIFKLQLRVWSQKWRWDIYFHY